MQDGGNMKFDFVRLDDVYLDGKPKGVYNNEWFCGYGELNHQIANYLNETHEGSVNYDAEKGIVEIPIKTWYKAPQMMEWWQLLSKEDRRKIRHNYVLFGMPLEPYSDNLYKELEKFCDLVGLDIQKVAVIVSNMHPRLQEMTYLRVINATVGFMTWFCRKWFENNEKLEPPELDWKPFSLLVARPRLHRIELLNAMADKNILEYGHVSFGAGKGTILGKPYDGPLEGMDYYKMCTDYNIKPSFKLASNLPLMIDNKQQQLNLSGKVGMEIVAECIVNDDYAIRECGIHAHYYTPTEKTWRPIYYGIPFMIQTSKESFKELKRLGYYLFEEYYTPDINGIATFANEIKRWSYRDFQNFRTSKLKHNKELFEYHSRNDIDEIGKQILEWMN